MHQLFAKKPQKSMHIYESEVQDINASQYHDPLLKYLTSILVRLCNEFILNPSGTSVLDIGCGVGRTSIALAKAGYTVVGFDSNERALELARQTAKNDSQVNERTEFRSGDALTKPPPEWLGAFDLVVCSEVIEHVMTPERVIAYARAVLRSGGMLILTTPHDREQWSVLDDYAGHFHRFSKAEARALLKDFEILELSTEGFPFQRLVIWAYKKFLARGIRHEFKSYSKSGLYRMYTKIMPCLLRIDHQFRLLNCGTTLVIAARRP